MNRSCLKAGIAPHLSIALCSPTNFIIAMFAPSLPRTTRHRLLICLLLLTGLLAAGAGVHSASAQQPVFETQDTQRYLWVNGGLVAGRTGIGVSVAGGIPFGNRAFSGARYVKMAKILSSENVWDAGPLVGLSGQGRYGHFSLGTGLVVVGGDRPAIENDKLPTLGVPVDVQLFLTPFRSLGIGLHGYANVNPGQNLLGVAVELHIRASQ